MPTLLHWLRKQQKPNLPTDILHFLQQHWQITPKNPHYYRVIFYREDLPNQGLDLERLEFLGDSAIQCATTTLLFHALPTINEGQLTLLRSQIVQRKHLNLRSQQIGLLDLVQKYAPTYCQGRTLSKNFSGNILEALVGAILLDVGYPPILTALKHLFAQEIHLATHGQLHTLEYKTTLNNWANKHHKNITFHHQYTPQTLQWHTTLLLNGTPLHTIQTTSKKEGEQLLSKQFLENAGILTNLPHTTHP